MPRRALLHRLSSVALSFLFVPLHLAPEISSAPYVLLPQRQREQISRKLVGTFFELRERATAQRNLVLQTCEFFSHRRV